MAELDNEAIRRAAVEIAPELLKLTLKYNPIVVLQALSEHVGGTLRFGMKQGYCSEAEAREILLRLRRIVFATGHEPNKGC